MERQVRQLLADKISGNQVGLWLLVPEPLRLGTWDLLCAWAGQPPEAVEPRLALQLVHEAALCSHGIRRDRSLSQKGFEVANGLPFVASDPAIHPLLAAHTVQQTQQLQIGLGKLRRASHHFQGQLLAIDPHRLQSYTRRQMRRHRVDPRFKAVKMVQTFFCLDTHTSQPICFTLASAARTAAQATPELLDLAREILNPAATAPPLVLADGEHYDWQVLDHVRHHTPFDLLVPMPQRQSLQRRCAALPPSAFTHHWAGYATAKLPFHRPRTPAAPDYQLVQRSGERPADYLDKSFLATADRPELLDLTDHYPDRWHVEEFFKFHQALGWDRAGTLNLNIRYAHMTFALVAQAVIQQLRQRLGDPFLHWDATHLANDLFGGLEGDVRVANDTIQVTYYNAPKVELLRQDSEHLPEKLAAQGLAPQIPWLYGFKLDFRLR